MKEFKPAFLFLARFLGLYLVGNLLYGFYIESCGQKPDWLTYTVTHQTTVFLNMLGEQTSAQVNPYKPTVFLNDENERILNVYEGCNGLNVMIVFVAFIFAFGGPRKIMPWFIGGGLLILHLSNIARIALLYGVAIRFQPYFYYVHKYFFTAILYLIVFSLWAVWIFKFNDRNTGKKKSPEATSD